MKCEIVIQNIDQYFDERLMELDPETWQHLASCQDCNLHFMAHKKAQEVVTRIADFKPILNDPSALTEDIMRGLEDASTTPGIPSKNNPAGIFKSVAFRRFLSGAAIILFAMFAYEQYLVLDKVNRLETQYKNVSTSNGSLKDIQMYNSWEFRILRNYNHIKINNKEMIKMINSLGNNISLSAITADHYGKYASETRDILEELSRQKELSPLVRTYIANIKNRTP